MKRSLILAAAAAMLIYTNTSYAQRVGAGGSGGGGAIGGGGGGGGLGGGAGAGGGNLGGVYIDPNGVIRGDGKGTIDRTVAPKLDAELAARSEIRRVSLKQLDRQVRSALENGEIPDSLRYVAGIVKVEYVIFDPQNHDILIAGPAEKLVVSKDGKIVGETSKRAPIQLDDLVVALRCVLSGPGEATCSIDPRPDGLVAVRNYRYTSADVKSGEAKIAKHVGEMFGLQAVRTTGVPETSRFATVMIEADYRMKRMALGLEKVKSIVSHLDSILSLKANNINSPTMVRWWFVPFYEPVLSNPEGTVYKFRGQGVRLETEEMAVDAAGNMKPAADSSEELAKFAETFSKLFPKLESSNAIFGDLHNLYDLMMTAALIKHTNRQAWVKDLVLLDSHKFELSKLTAIHDADPVISTRLNSRTENRNGQQARITSVISVFGGVSIKPGDVLGNTKNLEIGSQGSMANLMPGTSSGSAGSASASSGTGRTLSPGEQTTTKWWEDVSKIK